MRPWKVVNVNHSKPSVMTESLWKSISPDLDTSKFKFLETNLAIMSIFMKEIVPFNEDIKKLLKKLLQVSMTPSDHQSVTPQLRLPEQ